MSIALIFIAAILYLPIGVILSPAKKYK